MLLKPENACDWSGKWPNFPNFTKTASLETLNFLEFKITDLIDILLVAMLLYYVYKLLRGTVAIRIFIGLVLVWLFWNITKLLGMKMISNVVGGFIQVGFILLVVVFQQEIRKFLVMIGSANFPNKQNFSKYFRFLRQQTEMPTKTDVDAILRACEKMSGNKTGALIVLERTNSLDFIKSTGDKMNIEITQPILESIFYKNSPLHDGAAIVQGNKITATRVILPVSNERSIPLQYGLRHRAAIGITESTDALCLVVSEETGQISYIKDRSFVTYKSLDELSEKVKKDLG